MSLTTDALACNAAEAFDAAHPVGTPVLAWPGTRDDEPIRTRTRTGAWVLGGHTAVVMVDGVAGGIALTHIEHDPTRRPPVPEVEFEAPPCPMCGEDLDASGDGFECPGCEAHWDTTGRAGAWADPDAQACPATRRSFGVDTVDRCARPVDHDPADRHTPINAQEWWLDIDLAAITDGDGATLEHPPACSECQEYAAVQHGMCPSCHHNAVRSGWEPGSGA